MKAFIKAGEYYVSVAAIAYARSFSDGNLLIVLGIGRDEANRHGIRLSKKDADEFRSALAQFVACGIDPDPSDPPE